MLEVLFVLVWVVESLTEWLGKLIKPLVAKWVGGPTVSMALALLLGVLLAVLGHQSIFAVYGYDLFADSPLVAELITGVLISRGSNYLHDIDGKLSSKV